MKGFFASRTGLGTSSKDCHNRFETPLTERFFTCSKRQSRHLPTRFPTWIRCQVRTVFIFRRIIVVQYVKADT